MFYGWPNPFAEEEIPRRPRCMWCQRELSKTLDAYYGREAWKEKLCVKCRKPDIEPDTK